MGMVLGRITEELPAHTLVRQTSLYEIRRYPSQLAAVYNASTPAPSDTSSNSAFFALAGYFGIGSAPKQEAETPQPMAMTAPVFIDYAEDAEDSKKVRGMTFLLSAKYKRVEDAPKPSDPRVNIVELEPRVAAVGVFSGNFGPKEMKAKELELREALAKDGVPVVEGKSPVYAGYNPPFTVPWKKRNEVMVDVVGEGSPASGQTAE